MQWYGGYIVHAYTHICLASYENICIETMYYSTKCLRYATIDILLCSHHSRRPTLRCGYEATGAFCLHAHLMEEGH